MTVHDIGLADAASAAKPGRTGPVTAARQRRTWLIYGTCVALGLAPTLLGASPALQAAGLGLIVPGGGFLAAGGWAALLLPVTLIVFVASLVAWFWAGMVLAPLTVWLGAAALAAAMTGDTTWSFAAPAALATAAGIGLAFRARNEKQRADGAARFLARTQFVPQSLAEVRREAAQVPDPQSREMGPEELAALRYLLDRALQPVHEWGGFDIIDQFQPAALRYQLNHMGFGLGIAQRAYCPAFSGYLGEAQRNLIAKYLDRKVWGYWVYESCWGHLNFSNWDPARRDNIMLTGWFGMHVGQYMLASGDRRYLEPGSLSFRLDDKTTYTHDFTTIIGSVTSNYSTAEFGHFACEPNWIYPICNHYGMGSLAVADAVCGSDFVPSYLPGWLAAMDTEFTDSAGSIVGLRSQHTGLPVPFPVGEAGYAPFENIFVPDRAQRLWAIARRELEPLLVDEGRRLQMPGKGLDTGNYKAGHTGAYASIMFAANEFGDEAMAAAAKAGLDHDCGRDVTNGVRRYTAGSNDTNSYAVLAQLTRTGDFRAAFTTPPAPGNHSGPQITEVRYPDVLVAKAMSDGQGLNAVLYPGDQPGQHSLTLGQLTPGRTYNVSGATVPQITAAADGSAHLDVMLNGRTPLTVTPA